MRTVTPKQHVATVVKSFPVVDAYVRWATACHPDSLHPQTKEQPMNDAFSPDDRAPRLTQLALRELAVIDTQRGAPLPEPSAEDYARACEGRRPSVAPIPYMLTDKALRMFGPS